MKITQKVEGDVFYCKIFIVYMKLFEDKFSQVIDIVNPRRTTGK